jgi:hypothetical protein
MTDFHDKIDAFAIKVERRIKTQEQNLEQLPDFEYGSWLREQEQRAEQFFGGLPAGK